VDQAALATVNVGPHCRAAVTSPKRPIRWTIRYGGPPTASSPHRAAASYQAADSREPPCRQDLILGVTGRRSSAWLIRMY